MHALMAGMWGFNLGLSKHTVESKLARMYPFSWNHGPRFLEQNLAVDAFVSRIRVWEMGANVPEGKGSQERIANDMKQHIGVAVTH